ncbi:MAG: hypothetical protein CVV49_14075 [Spirochaetae bacterium HGW-Spirochaetae-5]|nr:MAG: hypothetical protein CVV49_14075 [Spirochaetae bacterium HGW-Spirochaetae-5]
MKVTADGILGSAQKINNKKKTEETEVKLDTKSPKSDSINISKVINSRIEALGKEVRDIQISLTKNQVIRDGIDQLLSAPSADAAETILNETTFNNSKILKDFVGTTFTPQEVESKKIDVKALISNDINSLTRIQVEMDNIIASDLTGSRKAESLMAGVSETLKKAPSGLENISNLDAEKVMKLIR